jgi:hypothetical protein
MILLAALSVGSAGLPSSAQQDSQVARVRYHFGDDLDGKLGWAHPDFDDSAWPVGEDGRWPTPAYYSDGFIWIRFRIPVQSHAWGPLAVRTSRDSFLGAAPFTLADEVYVDGVLAGREGSVPPHIEIHLPGDAVFDLPAAAAAPGKTAVVALRVWCPPDLRYPNYSGAVQVSIDEDRNLRLAQRADLASELYANGLNLALNVGIGILGIGMLLAWRWTGERDLLVFSWVMIPQAIFLLAWSPLLPGLGWLPLRVWSVLCTTAIALFLVALVELNWTLHRLHAPLLKRLGQAPAVIFALSLLIPGLSTRPFAVGHWAVLATIPADNAFQCVLLAVNVWAILARRTNPLLIMALIASPTVELLFNAGILPFGIKLGPFYEHPVALANFLADLAIFALLTQRAWNEWRARDELRVEFEAAREVQEQLVAPAVDLPGFKIESVYAPAKQVGGDFFRVLAGDDGSVLVVVGDVSGKGLKAAMTVSAIMGALRGTASRGPGEILAYLNRVLYGQMSGGQVNGFVTCCAALIATDGVMTIANAGNPAPYCNGEEMEVEPGLPLGLVAEAGYAETRRLIAAGDRLTFVSDGVVEATNPQGELYGFERTQAVSNQSANAIADEAKRFGQEDDITVLSIIRGR